MHCLYLGAASPVKVEGDRTLENSAFPPKLVTADRSDCTSWKGQFFYIDAGFLQVSTPQSILRLDEEPILLYIHRKLV
jgi:hypothetical protein